MRRGLAACAGAVIGCGRIGFSPLPDATEPPSGVITIAGGSTCGSADGPGAQAEFCDPVNLAFGPSDLLYINDFANDAVRTLDTNDPSFTVSTAAHVTYKPFGIAGTTAELYVETDFNSAMQAISSIVRVDLAAPNATVLASNFGTARGLVVLPDGTIAFSDNVQEVVRHLDPGTGVVTPIAGQLGVAGYQNGVGAAALFREPYGLALLPDGTIAVADIDNHRIRRVALDGTVTTIAGDGTVGTVDGIGLAARLAFPKSLAVDAVGNLYVGDDGAFVIRRISPAGMVTTIAGTVNTRGFADALDPLQAQFHGLEGITVRGRYLYVADGADGMPVAFHRIRRVDLASVPP
jgi:hypothetical protein